MAGPRARALAVTPHGTPPGNPVSPADPVVTISSRVTGPLDALGRKLTTSRHLNLSDPYMNVGILDMGSATLTRPGSYLHANGMA
jgi:hypothetical protein